ncbi:adhesion G-protein coupled receptor G1 [Parambassis ranga]|uniref:Adhesion G-protein coupled receptor G1 n=1 Tax=Parambassis ranga TaxID=210632 RepID=A0A6P7HZQ3_9TELE|nr:adhesion G-protein coupled receptor G5-like [Parambassis ranga]
MELRLTDNLKIVFFLIILFSTGSSEHDVDWNFCGRWRHGSGSLQLSINLSTGCKNLSLSANESTLSVSGRITAQCMRSDVITLDKYVPDPKNDTYFCVYWEPLLDQLKLEVGETNLTLCWPANTRESCCTDLSYGANTLKSDYGIFDGAVKTDPLHTPLQTAYNFNTRHTQCAELCALAVQGSNIKNMPKKSETNAEHPCAYKSEVELKDDATRYNVVSPISRGVSSEAATMVHIPPAVKKHPNKSSKVSVTFYQNNSLFQDGYKEVKVIDEVVEITVENEVIVNLSEPIRINFHHDIVLKGHSRRCVSWDTRKDPFLVNWSVVGCETKQIGSKHTECLCNHLTYFAVLVELEPRPVRHLLALTAITSLGCAVSFISCIALIIYLCRKKKRPKEQSMPIHLGLAVSLAFLCLLFFLTGVLANVGEDSVCTWVGPLLHYALLSSFMWMGVEVFHTFWLVQVVFRPSPKTYMWNLVGFVVPAVPVVILVSIGDIYGVREVKPFDDPSNPYRMCWMATNHKALLAHCFTTMTVLAILVSSGFVMLFLVYRKIRHRDEWKQNRVAFFSIWGLSCLFGTTWGLAFLNSEPIADIILFLFCILNSFQGFFLMLRFYMLDWMRKQADGSNLVSTSSGSTKQQMLPTKEKS